MEEVGINDLEKKLEKDASYSVTERREVLTYLGAALVGGGIFLARGTARAESPTEANPKRKHRWGMAIDVKRCAGCKACSIACKQENKTPASVTYTVVTIRPLEGGGSGKPVPVSKPCFHCENPPCVSACPVGATFKRDSDGIVAMDYDRCIGCRYCIASCPYGARYFDFGERYHEEKNLAEDVVSPEYGQYRMRAEGESPIGNVRKCMFCMHLQDQDGNYSKAEGRWPACAKTCTAKAIYFGDFQDPNSEVSRLLFERNAITLKTELGTNPNVYYLL